MFMAHAVEAHVQTSTRHSESIYPNLIRSREAGLLEACIQNLGIARETLLLRALTRTRERREVLVESIGGGQLTSSGRRGPPGAY